MTGMQVCSWRGQPHGSGGQLWGFRRESCTPAATEVWAGYWCGSRAPEGLGGERAWWLTSANANTWGKHCRASMPALQTVGSIPSSMVKAGFVCRAGD